MAEVFISYARDDRKLVEPIAARLKELGVDIWFDISIESGEEFEVVIKAELSKAKAVLVCWTDKASSSHWVRSEAKLARKLGTYVPVFVAECELPLALSEIHTDTLVSWDGAANDEGWLKVVERLSKNIGREAVAAAARAFAAGGEPTLYDFALRYPGEPAARRIWERVEARYRAEFERRLATAQAAAAERIKAERGDLDMRLAALTPAFEAWLADERRAAAKGPRPDPMALVEWQEQGEERRLRDEIATLSSALTQANTDKNADKAEVVWAKAEMARLSQQLDLRSIESQRLREEIAEVSAALVQAKSGDQALVGAKAEIERLSDKLAAVRAKTSEKNIGTSRSRAWVLILPAIAVAAFAFAGLSVLQLQRDVESAKKEAAATARADDDKLAVANAQVEALNRQGTELQAELVEKQGALRASAVEVSKLRAQANSSNNPVARASNEPISDLCKSSFLVKKANGELGANPDEQGYTNWCVLNNSTSEDIKFLSSSVTAGMTILYACKASFNSMKASGDLGGNPDERGYINGCMKN